MQNQLVYKGGVRTFRALLLLSVATGFSSPAQAADSDQALGLWTGAVTFTPRFMMCIGSLSPTCTDPIQVYSRPNPVAKNEPHEFRYGMDLGDYGPLRVKFTGTKIKLRWVF